MSNSPVHNHGHVGSDILAPLLDYVQEMEKSNVGPKSYGIWEPRGSFLGV